MRNLFTMLGFLLKIVGAVLLAVPYTVKHAPTIERVENAPAILLYVYRKGGFCITTSPILLMVGAVYFLWLFIRLSR